MSRMQRSIFGGLCAALIGLAVPANAAPGGLATAQPASGTQTIRVRGGGFGGHHGGGGFGGHHGGGFGGHHGGYGGYHGGGWGHHAGHWGHGGWGRHRGYPYFAYWGGYPYFDDYAYDDYDSSYDTCYYSRRLRARVCPEY